MSMNVKPASLPTRERLLLAASRFFAEKGFYGTSIRDVAEAVGISKPSLIHHFASKEVLYSAVLKKISADLKYQLDCALNRQLDELTQLQHFVDFLVCWADEHRADAQLFMRELLDNPQRLADIHHWHMKEIMDELVQLIEQGQNNNIFRRTPALPVVVNLLGTLHYAVAIEPTIRQMYPRQQNHDFLRQQARLIKGMLNAELQLHSASV